MSDIYKLQYNGMTLAYPGWNGYVGYDNVPSYRTLTLQTDGHGTLTASVLTGYPGDTITLSPTYNTYYRFNNYSVTGGTIAGNTFTFGNEDATVQANFKVNYFTATGGFDKGSNINCQGQVNGDNNSFTNGYVNKKAIHVAHTGDVSSAYWSASNVWHPVNFSAYSITLNAKMRINATGYTQGTVSRDYVRVTAACSIGNSVSQTAYYSMKKNTTAWYYSKSLTPTTQNTYGVSAHLQAKNGTNTGVTGRCQYIAAGTTGTWTATGIAP